jgi:hypothetical protein
MQVKVSYSDILSCTHAALEYPYDDMDEVDKKNEKELTPPPSLIKSYVSSLKCPSKKAYHIEHARKEEKRITLYNSSTRPIGSEGEKYESSWGTFTSFLNRYADDC